MTNEQVFARLRELGATSAVASFSGGNDEGGVDRVAIFAGADELDVHDEELENAIGEPAEQEYGGFTGDGVDGEYIWDVEARTAAFGNVSFLDWT